MDPKCDHCPITAPRCPAYGLICEIVGRDAEKRALFVELHRRHAARLPSPEEADRIIAMGEEAMRQHPRGGCGC